jgi:hypothetical protein
MARLTNFSNKRLPCSQVTPTRSPISWHVTKNRGGGKGYHAHLRRHQSPRRRQDMQLATEIRAAVSASRGTYGSPRLMHALRSKGLRHASTASTSVLEPLNYRDSLASKEAGIEMWVRSHHPLHSANEARATVARTSGCASFGSARCLWPPLHGFLTSIGHCCQDP